MCVEVAPNTSVERHTTRFSAHMAGSSDRVREPKVIEIVIVRLDVSWQPPPIDAFNMETDFANGTMIPILFNFQLTGSALGSTYE